MSDATRTVATAECPRCGIAWSGCASGVCEPCELLIADWWEGTFSYDLSKQPASAPTASEHSIRRGWAWLTSTL